MKPFRIKPNKSLKLISDCLSNFPGLTILCLFLFLISVASLKPDFNLMGWDNYSSYFNLKIGFFRTLFSTWRDYRGLGVPSDSEVTDIGRLIFFLIFKPIVGEKIIDQVYLLFAFIIGTLGMYLFSSKLFGSVFKQSVHKRFIDLFAFLSSFFYVFNLNTLATFYFPMVMFINRYFSLPLLAYVFLILLESNKVSLKKYFLIFLIIFLSSGSFMVATIFITTIIFLFAFNMFQMKFKRALLVFSFFIALNAFWLFPFLNYSIQKSAILPLAPTFIDANETNLNRPASYFSFIKQATFYPSFFYSIFTKIRSEQPLFFHPLTTSYSSFPVILVLLFFPIFYLIGSFLIFFIWPKKKELFWIPILTLFFLFLSLKEYSFLGFIYFFLEKYIPYFGIIFRFGDTKFHTYIAFCGSLASSFALIYLMYLITNKLKKTFYFFLFLLLILIPTLYIFRSYFNGNFIGFFDFNKLPSAYKNMARIINDDPANVRVLQLPIPKNGYWKSFQWGYLGSSFFHYLIDKPFIDATFEPGSMENAYLDEKIATSVNQFQLLNNMGDKNNRGITFYQLLKKTNVKYVLIDETTGTEIYPREVTYWGDFNLADSLAIFQNLEQQSLVRKIYSETIKIESPDKSFAQFYPTNKIESISSLQNKSLILYEIKNTDKIVDFLPSVKAVDPKLKQLLNDSEPTSENIIQKENSSDFSLMPFQRTDAQLQVNNNNINFVVPTTLNRSRYLISEKPASNNTSYLINIYLQFDGENYSFNFYNQYLPQINGQKFESFITSFPVSVSDFDSISNLKVENTVLNIPSNQQSNIFVGSALVHSQNPLIQFIGKKEIKSLDLYGFSLTQNPNCFSDQLSGYSYSFIKEPTGVNLTSKNGSSCIWQSLKTYLSNDFSYAEIEGSVAGQSNDLDQTDNKIPTGKPVLNKVIRNLNKPNILRLCIHETGIEDCQNLTQLLDLEKTNHFILPVEYLTGNNYNPLLVVALKNISYQEQSVRITDLKLNLYQIVQSFNLNIPQLNNILETVSFPVSSKIEFTLPKITTSFSSLSTSYYFSNQPCSASSGYRTFRNLNDSLISYVQNCSNEMFISLPFSSSNFYLGTVNYNLASGKFPSFNLRDRMSTSFDQTASLDQGYPNIPGFKQFQNPEFITSDSAVLKELTNLTFQNAYVMIPPSSNSPDIKMKDFVFQEDSENEGLILIKSFNVYELPSSWSTLSLSQGNEASLYHVPSSFTSKKILPSLWKIDVDDLNPVNPSLLIINNGYDKQWQLYDNFLNLILGINPVGVHAKCNGFANCYEITGKETKGKFYLLYEPERLSFLGWIISLIALPIFAKVFVRKNVKER